MEELKELIGFYNRREKHFDFSFFSGLSQFSPMDIDSKKDKKAMLLLLFTILHDLKNGKFDDLFFSDVMVNRVKCEVAISRIEKKIFAKDIKEKSVNFRNSFIGVDEDSLELIDSYYNCFYGGLSYILLQLQSYCVSYRLKEDVFTKIDEFELTNEIELEEIKTDKRVSKKSPTNISKIKALKELCPEFFERLEKMNDKKTTQKAIFLITGVNPEDAYKYSFGSRQSEVDNFESSEIDEVKDFLK